MVILVGSARRRRQRWLWLYTWSVRMLVAGSILFVAVYIAYEIGETKNETLVNRLMQDLNDSRQQVHDQITGRAVAEERLNRMQKALAQLEQDYERHIPKGELAELVDKLRERIQAGIPLNRLEFVIDQAKEERSCSEAIEVSDMPARTPTSTDVINNAELADGRLTVSVEGGSLVLEEGELPQFDPRKPVSIRVLLIDGHVEHAQGLLPFTHALVFDEKEYRIRAAASARAGHITVALQTCDYP